eukprot:4046611-Alexandrium_andersonii.AAC.1
MKAVEPPSPDELGLLMDSGKIEVEKRAGNAEKGRSAPRTMVWDVDLQRNRRVCEADSYISTSKHGDGLPAEDLADELPWMRQCLS